MKRIFSMIGATFFLCSNIPSLANGNQEIEETLNISEEELIEALGFLQVVDHN